MIIFCGANQPTPPCRNEDTLIFQAGNTGNWFAVCIAEGHDDRLPTNWIIA